MKRLALPQDLYSDVLGSLRQRRAAGKTVSKRQERSAWSAYWDTMARRQESVRKLQIIEDQLALQKKTAADNLALGRASLAQRKAQAEAQAALQRRALELQREIAQYNKAMSEQKIMLERRRLDYERTLSNQKMDLAREQSDVNAKAGTIKGVTSLASLGMLGYKALEGTELAKSLGLGSAAPALETFNAGNAVPLSFATDGSPIIGGTAPALQAAPELASSALPAMGAATPLLGGGAVTAGGTAAAGTGVVGSGALNLAGAAVPAAAPLAGDLGLGAGAAVGGSSAAGAGGVASSLLPGLGAVAAPLAIVALAKLLSHRTPFNPLDAVKDQFGTRTPDLQSWQNYMAMPEKDRKMDLMSIRGGNVTSPEHFDAWKQEAAKAGLWDLEGNRWNTQAGVVDGSTRDYNELGVPNRPGGMTPADTSGWTAFQNSNSYIPENQRAGYQFPTPGNNSAQVNTAAGPMIAQNQGFGPDVKKYPAFTDFSNASTQTTSPTITAANPLMANQNFDLQPAFSPPANMNFEMPSFNMPSFEMPSFDMPNYSIPSYSTPSYSTPAPVSNNWDNNWNDWSPVDDIFGNWGR